MKHNDLENLLDPTKELFYVTYDEALYMKALEKLWKKYDNQQRLAREAGTLKKWEIYTTLARKTFARIQEIGDEIIKWQ